MGRAKKSPVCKKAAKTCADLYCVADCIHGGKFVGNMVQCHLCQIWVHCDCVGVADADLEGIWSCSSCQILSSVVTDMFAHVKALEVSVGELKEANTLLVTLVSEQRQEMSVKGSQLTALTDAVCHPSNTTGGSSFSSPSSSDGFTVVTRKRSRAMPSTPATAATEATAAYAASAASAATAATAASPTTPTSTMSYAHAVNLRGSTDRPSGRSSATDRPSGRSSATERPSGRSTAMDRPSGRSFATDCPSGRSTVTDRPSGRSTATDRQSGRSSATDCPSGRSTAADRPSGRSTAMDHPSGGPPVTPEVVTPEVVVIGTSLVRGLGGLLADEGVDATVYCYPGQQIQHIKQRLHGIFSAEYQPRNIVVQCGGNDAETRPPHLVVREYDELVKELKRMRPHSNIILRVGTAREIHN